ncbi:tumor protein D53 isoform X2 [Boleophthalmus pectinirostris]|uniref:tumor protein D53 isoform X2 n=1 Tax=Boleophthalmus pectinirostris TaxID=150288 RepID=UPI0024313403|nr:tumor protein D53 isoform X2 [Boleophthalmus pectinirostris]
METRQQEQYSSVLSEAVLDWASMGPDGEWVNSNPHEGPQGVNQKEVGPNGDLWTEAGAEGPLWGQTPQHWDMSYTWDMQLDSPDRGHLSAGLDSQPLQEADEDLASEINLSNSTMTEEEREEIQQELTKLEEEISTLKQVLSSKEKQHAELKDKLGLTPLSELRNNFSRGWQDMTNSTAYKKTSETLSTAGQKTTAAFSNLGTALSRKLGDMRNSPSFKSFEEKVETTVSSIKTKVGGTGSGGSFEDVLSSAANASNQDTPTNSITPAPEGSC